jgi:hypothetical protein
MSEAERKKNSLREQLSRARGALANTLGISATARAGKRAAAESKQRLSDVLWNDRTLAASQALTTHASSSAPATAQTRSATPPAIASSARTAAVDPLPRPRVATPTPTPTATSRPPPIPAGAFAPPRARIPSPPPPLTAGRAEPVPVTLLNDLDFLIEADERSTSAVVPPRAQPPAPPPARKAPPAPPKPSPTLQPSAANGTSKAAAADPASDDEDEASAYQEPICTRSMARLLAGQGHRDRALAIYDVLLKQNATDASLRAEADALRATSPSS